MDPNRRSYYDAPGRPSSSSAMAPPNGAERERRDSAATLFGNRAGTPGHGGYNQASYSTIGRAEPVKGGWDEEEDAGLAPVKDDAWDVYADFNNAGPKYSSSYGNQHAYEPVGSPGLKHDDDRTLSNPGDLGQVEMVTVPALGAEWKASELHDMTASGKRARKAEDRGARWTAFRRGHRGLCGIPWLTRKILTFVVFGLIIAAGVTLAFTLPRVPGFALSIATPLQNATGSFANEVPTAFIRAPGANFSFPAVADVQVDTGSSFLAITLTDLNATVTDSQTNFLVATGRIARQVLKAHSLEYMLIPLNFSYTAPNASDQTWVNWHSACQNPNQITSGKRPGISFTLSISYNIFGLLGRKYTSTNVLNANCPITLPASAG